MRGLLLTGMTHDHPLEFYLTYGDLYSAISRVAAAKRVAESVQTTLREKQRELRYTFGRIVNTHLDLYLCIVRCRVEFSIWNNVSSQKDQSLKRPAVREMPPRKREMCSKPR